MHDYSKGTPEVQSGNGKYYYCLECMIMGKGFPEDEERKLVHKALQCQEVLNIQSGKTNI